MTALRCYSQAGIALSMKHECRLLATSYVGFMLVLTVVAGCLMPQEQLSSDDMLHACLCCFTQTAWHDGDPLHQMAVPVYLLSV